jgi:hypothetical protein
VYFHSFQVPENAPSGNRLGWRCQVLKRLLSHEIWGVLVSGISHDEAGAAAEFSIDAWEQSGYAEGYKFVDNRKMPIMSILPISISALWRRYSWFESMRGSHIRFGSETR